MADPSSRMLRLLSLLQHRPYWSGAELADRLDVSPRTVRRDVDRLRALGYPVRARPGIDGGYELAPGAALPPLVLDDDEALALVIGLHATINGAVTGVAEASLAALAKVVAVMPPRLRRRVDAVRAMTVPSELAASRASVALDTLATLAVACRNNERVAFAYVDREGGASDREVEPHRIVLVGDRWYLVAFDRMRHDWRTFRVDRLRELDALGTRFHPRALGVDAATFVEAGLTQGSARHTVEAVVDAPADEVRARIGQWATIDALDHARSRVTMTTESLDWPVFALGALGAEFTVVSPPDFAEQLGDWSRRFAAAATAHDQAGTTSGNRPSTSSNPITAAPHDPQ
ncbi:MAG TPA: YafY family protein [Acidimicrobiia bacterium]|nr:YafY family protein [Acidimicrobiia bacterium]